VEAADGRVEQSGGSPDYGRVARVVVKLLEV
jgi:hypothetical protein